MGFFKKLSRLITREYESVRVLKEGIDNYHSRAYAERSKAARIFEDLAKRIDTMSQDEFDAFRKLIPMLVITDRAAISSVIISGGLTSKQHETISSAAEAKSHLLYSAGFCNFAIQNYGNAMDLLQKALEIRPKPKLYNFREVKSDIEHWKIHVTENRVRRESVHAPSVVSKDQIEGEADEIVSFRDAEFFGITYLWLAKTLLYSRRRKTPEDFKKIMECLDAAGWYLERTRHYDFNLMLRGASWYDKGMCNYYQNRFTDAVSNFNQALPVYERGKSLYKSLELGFADCLLYRGECKLRLGDQKAATLDLEKALELSIALNQRDNIERAQRLLGRSTRARRRSGLTRGQIIDLGMLLKERPDLAPGDKTIAVVECPKCGFLNPLQSPRCLRCGQPTKIR